MLYLSGGFNDIFPHLAEWHTHKRERERESSLRLHLAPDRPAPNHIEPLGNIMRLKILLSYWYYKDADLDALFAKYFTEPYPEVFADSGAFSAATQGAQISPAEYAAWVKKYKHLFSTYSNLDVIGNPVKTLENQKHLEDLGINPIPVFHASANYDALENYLATGYRYIALGGLVPYAAQPKVRIRFLIKAFKIANAQAVFHGFGVTSWEVMSKFPWYSVDSSSWGSGFRFGTVPVFDPKAGRFLKCNLGDVKSCSFVGSLLENIGFDWRDFADRKRNDRAKICAVSALAYMQAEQYLRRKFGDIYIPGGDAPAVLRAHLADANPQRYGDIHSGMDANEAGLRLHLVDSPHTPLKDTSDASAVLRLHLSDTSNGINYGDAATGIKLHLADARGHTAADLSAANSGLKIHLAEHSLDRGGVGDTSRAAELLK